MQELDWNLAVGLVLLAGVLSLMASSGRTEEPTRVAAGMVVSSAAMNEVRSATMDQQDVREMGDTIGTSGEADALKREETLGGTGRPDVPQSAGLMYESTWSWPDSMIDKIESV